MKHRDKQSDPPDGHLSGEDSVPDVVGVGIEKWISISTPIPIPNSAQLTYAVPDKDSYLASFYLAGLAPHPSGNHG